MKAIHTHTMTVGQQFLPTIFNGDTSHLSPSEETQIEQEHHDNVLTAEEKFGDRFVSVEYECKSSERYICKCDLTRLLSECVEVKVIAMVKEDDGPSPEAYGHHPEDTYFGVSNPEL